MTDADTRGRVMMVADCVYRGDRYQLSAHVPGAHDASRSAGAAARLMRVLAVDGGQSAIRLRHSSSDRGRSRCAGVSRLEGDTVDAVGGRRSPRAGGRAAFGPVDRVVLGLSRPRRPTGPRRTGCAAHRRPGRSARPRCGSRTTRSPRHAGALSLGWGVSVTAGTGVACLAVRRDRRAARLGGHGFLLGDEGGAFWIGREGLRAVLRAADGRGPRTALWSMPRARRFDGLADLAVAPPRADRPGRRHRPLRARRARGRPRPATRSRDGIVGRGRRRAGRSLVRAAVEVAGTGRRRAAVPVALGGRLLGERTVRCGDASTAALARGPMRRGVRTADGSPLDGALRAGRRATIPGRYAVLVHVSRLAGTHRRDA